MENNDKIEFNMEKELLNVLNVKSESFLNTELDTLTKFLKIIGSTIAKVAYGYGNRAFSSEVKYIFDEIIRRLSEDNDIKNFEAMQLEVDSLLEQAQKQNRQDIIERCKEILNTIKVAKRETIQKYITKLKSDLVKKLYSIYSKTNNSKKNKQDLKFNKGIGVMQILKEAGWLEDEQYIKCNVEKDMINYINSFGFDININNVKDFNRFYNIGKEAHSIELHGKKGLQGKKIIFVFEFDIVSGDLKKIHCPPKSCIDIDQLEKVLSSKNKQVDVVHIYDDFLQTEFAKTFLFEMQQFIQKNSKQSLSNMRDIHSFFLEQVNEEGNNWPLLKYLVNKNKTLVRFRSIVNFFNKLYDFFEKKGRQQIKTGNLANRQLQLDRLGTTILKRMPTFPNNSEVNSIRERIKSIEDEIVDENKEKQLHLVKKTKKKKDNLEIISENFSLLVDPKDNIINKDIKNDSLQQQKIENVEIIANKKKVAKLAIQNISSNEINIDDNKERNNLFEKQNIEQFDFSAILDDKKIAELQIEKFDNAIININKNKEKGFNKLKIENNNNNLIIVDNEDIKNKLLNKNIQLRNNANNKIIKNTDVNFTGIKKNEDNIIEQVDTVFFDEINDGKERNKSLQQQKIENVEIIANKKKVAKLAIQNISSNEINIDDNKERNNSLEVQGIEEINISADKKTGGFNNDKLKIKKENSALKFLTNKKIAELQIEKFDNAIININKNKEKGFNQLEIENTSLNFVNNEDVKNKFIENNNISNNEINIYFQGIAKDEQVKKLEEKVKDLKNKLFVMLLQLYFTKKSAAMATKERIEKIDRIVKIEKQIPDAHDKELISRLIKEKDELCEKYAEQMKEVGILSEKCEALGIDNKTLQQKNIILEENNKKLEIDLEKLRINYENLLKRFNEKQAEESECQKEIILLKEKIEKYEKEQMVKNNDNNNKDNNNDNNSIELLNKLLEEKEKQISILIKEKENIKVDLTKVQSDLDNLKYQKLKNEKDDEIKIKELEVRIKNYEISENKWNQEKIFMEQKLMQLEQQYKDSVLRLQNDLKTKNEELREAQIKYEELLKQQREKSSDIEIIVKDRELLIKEIGSLKERMDFISKNNSDKDNNNNTELLNELKLKIQQLQEELSLKEKNIIKLNEDKKQLELQILSKENENNMLMSKVKEYADLLNKLEYKKSLYKNKFIEYERMYNGLLLECKNKEIYIHILQQQLEEANKKGLKVEGLEERIIILQKELEAKRNKIIELKLQLRSMPYPYTPVGGDKYGKKNHRKRKYYDDSESDETGISEEEEDDNNNNNKAKGKPNIKMGITKDAEIQSKKFCSPIKDVMDKFVLMVGDNIKQEEMFIKPLNKILDKGMIGQKKAPSYIFDDFFSPGEINTISLLMIQVSFTITDIGEERRPATFIEILHIMERELNEGEDGRFDDYFSTFVEAINTLPDQIELMYPSNSKNASTIKRREQAWKAYNLLIDYANLLAGKNKDLFDFDDPKKRFKDNNNFVNEIARINCVREVVKAQQQNNKNVGDTILDALRQQKADMLGWCVEEAEQEKNKKMEGKEEDNMKDNIFQNLNPITINKADIAQIDNDFMELLPEDQQFIIVDTNNADIVVEDKDKDKAVYEENDRIKISKNKLLFIKKQKNISISGKLIKALAECNGSEKDMENLVRLCSSNKHNILNNF